MNSNYYYSNVMQSFRNKAFLEDMQTLADSIKQQVYVLSGPLIDGKYQYNDESLMIVLSSKKKIAFVTTKKVDDNFEDLCEDIIEDIGSVSDKYGYKEKIGRPRKWKNKLTAIYTTNDIVDIKEWFSYELAVEDTDDYRTLDLLVSLFIGCINDVKNITTEEPENLLDKVKHKIQLFDGQQTRFIYEELEAEGKRITIQGLSGTGKTELLMHKLKDLYVKNKDAVFGFTCFNKILARKFFLVIPYQAAEKSKDFRIIKEQLQLLADIVIKALEKLGMKVRKLETIEILDLFYSFYNPNQIKSQLLTKNTLEKMLEAENEI